MTNHVVELDNDIGQGTIKDEGSGVNSLDVNIRSGTVTVVDPTDRYTKYYNDFTEIELSCNPTTWTLFYTVDFSPNDKYFLELIMFFDNDHMFKVEIGSELIIDISLKNIKDNQLDAATAISENIRCTLDGKITRLNLNNFRGPTLKVYQKRRDANTGNLKMKGLIMVYGEDAL